MLVSREAWQRIRMAFTQKEEEELRLAVTRLSLEGEKIDEKRLTPELRKKLKKSLAGIE